MKPLSELRKVEVLMPSGLWVRSQMGQIDPGDIFRLVEPDGTLVMFKGATEFVCKKPAFLDADPVGTPDAPPSKLLPTIPQPANDQ